MEAKFICLEERAFHQLIEEVVERLAVKYKEPQIRWIDGVEAMKRLGISGKSTLQRYRDEGRIRFSKADKRVIMYDVLSIEEYLEKHAIETL